MLIKFLMGAGYAAAYSTAPADMEAGMIAAVAGFFAFAPAVAVMIYFDKK